VWTLKDLFTSKGESVMQKWEYLIVAYIALGQYSVNGFEAPELRKKKLPALLNELGGQGWELIYMEKNNEWIFKRPKS
jgi:hypothetical protein